MPQPPVAKSPIHSFHQDKLGSSYGQVLVPVRSWFNFLIISLLFFVLESRHRARSLCVTTSLYVTPLFPAMLASCMSNNSLPYLSSGVFFLLYFWFWQTKHYTCSVFIKNGSHKVLVNPTHSTQYKLVLDQQVLTLISN